MLRHLHIIIVEHNSENIIKDNFKKNNGIYIPYYEKRKYVTDVFDAFPDVKFTL